MHTHRFDINGRVGKIIALNKATKVSIASTISYYDKAKKERVYEPRWNTVTIFDENVIKYISENVVAGDLVQTVGELYDDSYDKNGEKVYTTVLKCLSFVRLAKKVEQDDAHH